MTTETKRNKFEQVKAEREGLDIGAEIDRFAREGWESIPDDDRDIRLKWWGVFYRKQTTGHFMVRIRIPNGIASAEQVRTIAEIATRYGRDMLDITTRQQVQLRWIRIEDMPAVLKLLNDAGLVTLQTGLDNIRGVTGCAVAGLSPNELFDASPAALAFNERFVGNSQFTNLPRKFNVAMTGCTENCVHAAIQDLAMVPAIRRIDGREVAGFNVLVGGKMGSGGFTAARPLDAFVEPDDASEVAAAVALVFRDHGFREARSHARLAFLIDEWGIDRFRAEVEERLGYRFTPAGEDRRSLSTTDHIGVHAQKQPGFSYVGLHVPVGRTSGSQMAELAGLAEKYGCSDLRFTPGQNVIVAGVADASLEAFLAEPLLETLRYSPSEAARGTVSCTGKDFCSLALIETKSLAMDVVAELESSMDSVPPVSISWSGCPAGCGNHGVSDIGLMGRRTRIGEEIIDTVDIFVGGSAGPDAVGGMKLMQDVPCADAARTIQFLVENVDFNRVRAKLRASRVPDEAATLTHS
jgi:ferredoxin-nitrite reductase